ncbi:hypothetical protein L195_g048151, partial [Trifolium pratense]
MYDFTGPPKVEFPRRAVNEEYLVGLSDVAFASTNPSLIVASDYGHPTVAVWDTRAEDLPIRQLQTGLADA